MIEPPPKSDWRDGLAPAGILMVLLCGLCSGWTVSLDDPYFTSGTLFVGGPPIALGFIFILLGLTRPRGGAGARLDRRNLGMRLDAALRMAIAAIILLFAGLAALGLAVSLSTGMIAALVVTGDPGRGLVALLLALASFAIPAIICALALMGGLALFRAGQDRAR